MYAQLSSTANWQLFAEAAKEIGKIRSGERPTFTFRRAFDVYRELRGIARQVSRDYPTATPEQHRAYLAFARMLASDKSYIRLKDGIPWNHHASNLFLYGPAPAASIWALGTGMIAMMRAIERSARMDEQKSRYAWSRIEKAAPEFAKRVRSKPRGAFNSALAVDADEGDC